MDSLTTFVNTAKRTGKWDTKKLQLKTVPLDRIIGISTDETYSGIPLHKEIQHRDERIEVLQAEIEQLRKTQTELAKQVERLIIKLFHSNQFRFILRQPVKIRVFLHLWPKMI